MLNNTYTITNNVKTDIVDFNTLFTFIFNLIKIIYSY